MAHSLEITVHRGGKGIAVRAALPMVVRAPCIAPSQSQDETQQPCEGDRVGLAEPNLRFCLIWLVPIWIRVTREQTYKWTMTFNDSPV